MDDHQTPDQRGVKQYRGQEILPLPRLRLPLILRPMGSLSSQFYPTFTACRTITLSLLTCFNNMYLLYWRQTKTIYY